MVLPVPRGAAYPEVRAARLAESALVAERPSSLQASLQAVTPAALPSEAAPLVAVPSAAP